MILSPTALVFLCLIAAGPAVVQDYGSRSALKADHLSIETDPASGTADLKIFNADGKEPYQTEIIGFEMDGESQKNFEIQSEDPLTLANDKVRIELEILDERTIPIHQHAVDNKKHNFKLKIRSHDEAQYYKLGTG